MNSRPMGENEIRRIYIILRGKYSDVSSNSGNCKIDIYQMNYILLKLKSGTSYIFFKLLLICLGHIEIHLNIVQLVQLHSKLKKENLSELEKYNNDKNKITLHIDQIFKFNFFDFIICYL